MFFIGEYASMISLSFVVSLIFLGGFNPLGFIPGGIAILLKVMFLSFYLCGLGQLIHTLDRIN